MFSKLKYNIKNFCTNFNDWGKKKILLFSLIAFFLFFSSFSTMAFSARYPLNYLNAVIYFFLILFIILFVSLYGYFRFDIFFVLLLLFNFTVLLSSLLTGFRNFSFTIIFVTSVSFFVYQIIININKEIRMFLLLLIFLGGIVFSLYFMFYYRDIILNFDFNSRIGGYFDNLNEMAKYFVFLSIISLYLFLFKKKVMHLVFALIFFIFLVLTGSRSNLLAFTVAILVLIYLRIPKRKKISLLLFICLSPILLFLLLRIKFMENILIRLYASLKTLINSSDFDNVLDFSTKFRKIASIEAFELFLQRPLFGYGFWGTNIYSFNKMSTHNNFTALLGNFGIIAFLIFQAFLIFPIYSNIKKNKNINYLFIALLLYIFVFQTFLITFTSKFEYLIFPFTYATFMDSPSYNSINLKIRIKH